MKQVFDVAGLATSRFSPPASASIAAVAPMRRADQRADREPPAVVCPWCDKEPVVDHGLRPAQAALGACIWACGARPRWPSSCWRTRPTCLSTAAATRTVSRTTTTGALQRSPLRFSLPDPRARACKLCVATQRPSVLTYMHVPGCGLPKGVTCADPFRRARAVCAVRAVLTAKRLVQSSTRALVKQRCRELVPGSGLSAC